MTDDRRPYRELFVAIGSVLTVALLRATIGASPKPSTRTKDIYEQAFLSALR